MIRLTAVVLSAAFVTGAAAQSPAPASATPRITPGDYTGRLQEEGGSRTAEIKVNVKHVTNDGRVTATVQSTHDRKACAARLPLNGIILPDGDVRAEVNDGAPEGCERIYHLRTTGGGTLSGKFIDAVKRDKGKKLVPGK